MSTERYIKGREVKDLITKYFYHENHLCFQILLHLEGNRTFAYKEFSNYSEYKKAFNELQQARTKNGTVAIPNKNLKFETNGIKVA